ncbi:HET-domain-containing protein [Ophiobolus disseminans]|uniref:HET-domain-containing protein n=1 Tax=Ophiobolus disseminans TaxID=1469910 RepID=A0A6A6ZQJ7_9PLEO|nr:HET-domain-containing protein [Ophiobolus disseminans]
MARAIYNGISTMVAFLQETSKRKSDMSRASKHSQNTYLYEAIPTDEIATYICVIELQHAKRNAPLLCKLLLININRDPQYEALSYCWGSPYFDYEFEIEDQGILKITWSLYRALVQVRSLSVARRVWADAVCINQQDIPERNSQVQLMRDIYQGSECVTVWLDEGTRHSDLGTKTIPTLIEALQRKEDRKDARDLSHLSEEERQGYGFPRSCGPAMRAVSSLLESLWFSRTWIVQEIALARSATVTYGSHSVPWKDLAFVFQQCQQENLGFDNLVQSPGFENLELPINATRDDVFQGLQPPLLALVARCKNA